MAPVDSTVDSKCTIHCLPGQIHLAVY